MTDTMSNTSGTVQGLNANGAFDFAVRLRASFCWAGRVTETALSGGGVTADTGSPGDATSAARYAAAATVLAAGAS